VRFAAIRHSEAWPDNAAASNSDAWKIEKGRDYRPVPETEADLAKAVTQANDIFRSQPGA
jgi:hypothetical protein